MADEEIDSSAELDTVTDELAAAEQLIDFTAPLAGEDDAPIISAEEQSDETPGDSYKDADADTLRSLLSAKDKELETSSKRYDDLRSLGDRRNNEDKVERARLEERMTALQNQQAAPSAEAAAAAQAKFEEDWIVELNENPGKAVEYFQGVGSELRAEFQGQLDALRAELSAESQQRQRLDPEVQEHLELIDSLVNEDGLDLQTAKAIALKVSKKNGNGKVAQGPRAAIPSSDGAGKRTAPQGTRGAPSVRLGGFNRDIMSMAGLTEEDQADVARETAAELAGGS